MKIGTGNNVLKAYNKAVEKLESKLGKQTLSSSAVSAGFIFAPGQKRGEKTGYQVFVKVIRYSDKHLKYFPNTGGLLADL